MRRFVLLLVAISVSGVSMSQSGACDNTAGAEIIPGATCVPQTFNSNLNTDYWNSAGTFGVCNESDVDDIWGWFTATSTTTIVTYNPANGDPILTIFSGACAPTMSAVVACSDNIGTTAETVTFSTAPGTVYHIRVQNYSSNATMNGTICVNGTAGGGSTTASDCTSAVNVCTDLSFQIDPNGFGAINEVPAAGSFGNPSTNPGSSNMGCLQIGEYNSTWMIVNIATSGLLEFSMGAGGAQAGYYDWIMYPYSGAATCAAVQANTLAPLRCNWNLVNYGGTGMANTIPAGGDAGNYEPGLAVTAGQQYLICFSNYSNSSTSVPLQFFTGVGDAGVSCTPLGFELKDMFIQCHDDFREISWKLPVDNVVSTMTLQKSRDGESWESLQSYVNGDEDNNGFMNFNYYDQVEPSTLAYYRIKQAMNSGTYAYSNIVSADCKSDKPFEVYPNPSHDILNLEYESLTETELTFYSLTGERIYNVDLPKTDNMSKVQINTEGVKNGIYVLKIILNDEVHTTKVVIQH